MVLNRLLHVSVFECVVAMFPWGSVPLLDFVVPVIRFLDMTCWRARQQGPPEVWDAWNKTNAPVFIITCVVARLTFFLKPASRWSAGDREGAGGGVR